MISRRGLLGAAAAGSLGLRAASRNTYSYADVESRIARRDFKNLYKEDLPTPCMVLDLALFERNLKHMAAALKTTGLNLRPHVKIHKSPEVTRRQQALGAIGACCATIAEAELISGAGHKGVLFTCQPAGKNKISRVAALSKKDPTFLSVADAPLTVDLLDEAAAAEGTKVNVLVDCYVGLTRQGIQPGEAALALAKKIDGKKNLKLRGLMGYSGDASHTKGWDARRKRSLGDLAPLAETALLFKKAGLTTEIMTGGSTGTYNIDHEVKGMTELQAGSYIFMDTAYMKVGGKSGDEYTDFAPALTVMTTVVSQTRPGQCAIDAGNKAMLRVTDQVKGRPGVKIENQGAEYGMLLWNQGDRDIKLGERVEIYPTNLDTSTNVYDRYYVADGDRIVDVWPIMGRAGAPQR